MRGRKFKVKDVLAIRRDLDKGADIGKLSRKYGVTGWAISDILNLRTWNNPRFIPEKEERE